MNSSPPEPISELERARLDIVHLKLDEHEDLWRAVDSALRISAGTLSVARVGVWFMTGDQRSLYRARVYGGDERTADDTLLPLANWPSYAEAIASRRVVAANDVSTDARTQELVATYCAPLGITSMLDAPLFLTGEVRGIVCHEHIGPARTWTQREIDFAVSVADMLGALLEQSMRLSAERRLRAADASAARARELALAARTAASIAHDVNTVLQAITSSAGTILEDCRRSARLLDELRELEHMPVRSSESICIGDVIDALRPTLDALVGTERRLLLDIDRAGWVNATRTDVERILLNLVTNARDVTGRDGTIGITVIASDQVVTLEVRDEGPGLDPALAERVFDPYYSTKRDGRGGLGLFIVELLTQRTGGMVSIKTVPGKGTTFIVTWPAP